MSDPQTLKVYSRTRLDKSLCKPILMDNGKVLVLSEDERDEIIAIVGLNGIQTIMAAKALSKLSCREPGEARDNLHNPARITPRQAMNPIRDRFEEVDIQYCMKAAALMNDLIETQVKIKVLQSREGKLRDRLKEFDLGLDDD